MTNVAKGPWSSRGLQPQDHTRRKESMDTRYSGGRGKGYLIDVLESFVPREGQNKIRIVEPIELDDIGWYSIEVAFHRAVGFNKDYYLCNQEMKIGPCYHNELQTGELWDTDPEQAKKYFPDRRVLMLVLDLLSEDPDKVRKWSCAIGLADEVVNQCHDPDTDTYRNPADPQTGMAIFFERHGQGLRTKYSGVKIGSNPHPLTDHHANQRVPFTDLLVVPEYEEVKAAFLNEMPPEHVTEGPPLESYEQDASDKSQPKYEQQALPTAGEVLTPKGLQDAALEEMVSHLKGMDRDGLKRVKVNFKADIEALQFPIYKNTSDEEILEQICNAVVGVGSYIDANGVLAPLPPDDAPELEPEVEPEMEPEVEPEPERVTAPTVAADKGKPPAVAGSQDKERVDVKAALAAAISNRQKQ